MKDRFEQQFGLHKDRYVSEWMQLLRFPSISADPARHGDCRRCAEWLAGHLQRIGFEAELRDTAGRPVVFGCRPGDPGRPVVLFYAHYDVQPVDPLEQWDSPPFEPEIRDGRVYARGAEDDKGQLFYVLKAMETLVGETLLGCTVKILIEGEEECGSGGVAQALDGWREHLVADVLMVADTNTVSSGAPTIIMGLRGIAHLSILLRGPSHDLHSGVHGGVAPNPAQGIATLLASLHHPDGTIAVPGFCDTVIPPSPRESELAAAEPFDEAGYTRETGVRAVAGDRRYTPAERTGFLPSIDINGVHSGFDGPGMKTIIPSHATARLTARLAPGQDPEACVDLLAAHLACHTPRGLSLEITDKGAAGAGFRLDLDSPIVAKARRALEPLADRPPALLWEGASIPIVARLAEVSGASPLLIGFGQECDRAHAPNESFSLEQFRRGYLYACLMLASL